MIKKCINKHYVKKICVKKYILPNVSNLKPPNSIGNECANMMASTVNKCFYPNLIGRLDANYRLV